jgi:hypothetical protein
MRKRTVRVVTRLSFFSAVKLQQTQVAVGTFILWRVLWEYP